MCSTKSQAKSKMIDDWNSFPRIQLYRSLWKMHRSQYKIESQFSVYKYVSLHQVLHNFDGVDNIDKFRIDESASGYSSVDTQKAVEILCNSGTKRESRSKQWFEWCRGHNC